MKSKRVISLVLALCLCLTMLPVVTMPVVAASNIVINGIDIGYANGSYFTKNGSTCKDYNNYDIYGTAQARCHNRTGYNCSTTTDPSCNCMRYWPTGLASTCQVDLKASQCFGYARYCQWRVYGTYDSNSPSSFTDITGDIYSSSCTGSYLKQKLINCAPATHLRTFEFVKDYGHSICIIGTTDYGVTFTDCNSDGCCIVREETMSWDELATYVSGYGGIDYANSYKNAVSTPTVAYLTINNVYNKIGQEFVFTLSSDVACDYYLSICDSDSGEYVIQGEKVSSTYKNSFSRAGHYFAWMTAANSKGSKDSNFVDFWVFDVPPTTATLSVNKSEMALGETVTLTTSTNAYYVRIAIAMFLYNDSNNGTKVCSGEVPYNYNFTPSQAGIYTGYVTAWTHEGGVDSNWVTFYVGKYNVSYNANGGSGVPSSQTKYYGKDITLSTAKPTRTGYTFLGWATSSTATTATYQPGDTFTGNANTTLYAVWKANTTDINRNTSNNAVISTGGEMQYFTYTPLADVQYVIYSTGSDDTKVYLYDADWNELASDDDSGAGTNFRLEYDLTPGRDYIFGIKYYDSSKTGTIPFKFGNVFTVSYDANGGSGAPSSQNKDYGADIILSSTVPTRTGYTFLGWSTSSTATTATYQPSDTYTSNANTTLYAVWKLNTYTISYNANGGTGAPDSQTKIYGVNLTLSNTVPTRTGYTFLGWSNTLLSTTVTHQPGGSFTTDKNTTLYAVWKKGCENDAHTYSYTVTKLPTVSEQGTLTGTCSMCEGIITIDLPKFNTDDYIYEVTKAPDCTNFGAGGYTWKNTSYGNYSFNNVLIPATGHTHIAVVTKPTCTEQGYTTYTCHCGDSYVSDYVKETGHSYGDWYETKAPTCTEVGEERRDCDNCDHFETSIISELGHDKVHHNAKEATCTEFGWNAYETCNRCEYTTYVEIPATGHSHTATVTKPTCTEQGYTTYTCHCGDSYVSDYVKETGHSYGDWYETKAPTCTEAGEERRDCDNCDHFETNKIEATGHDYTTVLTKPTCTEQGYTTHTCKCGDSYVDTYTDALGHSFTDYISDNNATTEADGTKTAKCDNGCGAKDTVTDVGSKLEIGDITSDKYTVSYGFIQGISINTTVNGLISSINESDFVKVVDKNGNPVSGNALIGTDMKVQLVIGGKVIKEVVVVVTGDTNGDGKITVTDMIAVKSHILNKSKLSGAAAKAGDANNDNGISITDFIRIKAHILGKSSVAGTTKSAGEPVAYAVNAETVETESQNIEQSISSDTETMYYLYVEKFMLPEVKNSSGSYLNK